MADDKELQLQTQEERIQEQRSTQATTTTYDSSRTRYIGSPNYKCKGSTSKREKNWPSRPWIDLKEEESNERAPTGNDSKRCVQFTIASYNLLAQSLLEKNSDLYAHCPPAFLAWDHRRQRLLDELAHYNADVYCLQEVEETAFHEWFEPELRKQDYHGVFKKRTGQQSDGCAVFFKEATFELDKVELIEYQRNCGILNRDNIGMVLLLKPKLVSATKQLCVATTHLLFNPKAGEIKLAQLCLLLAEIYKLTSNGCPILLCGDFNMRPLCPLYAFIEQGALDYSRVSAPEIAGYFHGRNNRRIPSPLFPPSFGISTNCMYEVVRDLASQDDHQKQHCSSAVLKRSRVCDSDSPRTDRLMKDDMPKRSKRCEDQLPERDGLLAPQAYYRPPFTNPWTMPLPQMPAYNAHFAASTVYSRAQAGSCKPPLLMSPWPPNFAPYLTQRPPMTMPLVPMSMYCAPPARNHLLPHPSSRQHVVGTTSGPEGEMYQHFQPSESRKGNSRVTHSFNFKSAYPHQACQDNGPSSVTTFHLKAFETVDYIFHTMPTGSSDACQLRLLARLALPSNRTLKEVGPLPNADISSDHIILCAKFEFIC